MQDQGLTRFGLQRGLSSWFADSRLSGSLYTQPHWELGPQRMNLRGGGGDKIQSIPAIYRRMFGKKPIVWRTQPFSLIGECGGL